jgi:hypothetical protein
VKVSERESERRVKGRGAGSNLVSKHEQVNLEAGLLNLALESSASVKQASGEERDRKRENPVYISSLTFSRCSTRANLNKVLQVLD